MSFSNSAAPTRANLRKRLRAAYDALDSAYHLAEAGNHPDHLRSEVLRAQNATFAAQRILAAEKGARR